MLTVDPEHRLTLSDVFQHPWCMRPSQLAKRSPLDLANKLTQPLRDNGDLQLAAPNLNSSSQIDEDEDEIMLSATHQSQFTQSLMLFSQTQSGNRYTPHLTRFYAALGPSLLMSLIKESLEVHHVKCKLAPPVVNDRGMETLRLRVGGYDQRKEMFKGWVEVEKFVYRSSEGSFCVMKRDEGSPISWRQLWKGLIKSPLVEPHVLRK